MGERRRGSREKKRRGARKKRKEEKMGRFRGRIARVWGRGGWRRGGVGGWDRTEKGRGLGWLMHGRNSIKRAQ